MSDNKSFNKIGNILSGFDLTQDKYISKEFQKYGYELSRELGDMKRKALYIKLAKEHPRAHLESARNFVKDAYNVKSKPKLFMWKLQQIKAQENLPKK